MSDDLFAVDEPDAPQTGHGAYTVGYGKPPKTTQFKPGQSGNPKGRKKGAKSLKTIVESVAFKKVSVRTEKGIKKIPQHQALVEKTMQDALQGDAKARSEMFKLLDQAGLNDRLADDAEDQMRRLSEEDQEILTRIQSSKSQDRATTLDDET